MLRLQLGPQEWDFLELFGFGLLGVVFSLYSFRIELLGVFSLACRVFGYAFVGGI